MTENKNAGYTAKDWKAVAVERRLENKELKKRLAETKEGREKWKKKSIAHKERADKLEKELKQIKKKIEQIVLK